MCQISITICPVCERRISAVLTKCELPFGQSRHTKPATLCKEDEMGLRSCDDCQNAFQAIDTEGGKGALGVYTVESN
jgi:hypothetical protein